jgi:hypothetical protein
MAINEGSAKRLLNPEPVGRGRVIGLSRLCMVLVTALLLGCTQKHPVSLSSDIPPPPVAKTNVQARVAVFFKEPMRSYRHHVDAIRLLNDFHSYDFKIGPTLCNALLRSVNNAYSSVAEISRPASPGDYPLVIVFSLQKSQIDVSFEERLTPSARAYSLFVVSVDVFNGKTMVPFHSSTVNGRAFLIRALGKVSSQEAEKVFAAAIESSIQQLAGNAVALLAQWAEEPSPQQ